MPPTEGESPAPQSPLTHLTEAGAARMVHVEDKGETRRTATAVGVVHMAPSTLALIVEGKIPKGEVLPVARLAAIQAVKRTAEMIPLCHPLRITGVDVTLSPAQASVHIKVQVTAYDRTGVEMEALHAVTVAALTLYDMCKAVDRAMVISDVGLVEKTGGRSGTWSRAAEEAKR